MEPSVRTLRDDELLAQLGWVRELARSLVRDSASADDLVQDTWLAAARSDPQLGDEPSLRRWLATVVRNLARKNVRSNLRRTWREASVARAEAQDEDVLARGALQSQLAAAVMSLDEPQRSAVLLRYLDGLSALEVAQRQGVSHAAARKRISRGLAELRARLDAAHGGDRSAWRSALVAWIEPGASGVGFATLATSGVLAMVWKFAVAAVLVAALWFGWMATSRNSHAPQPALPSTVATSQDSADVNVAPGELRSRASVETPDRSAAQYKFELVDENGAPRANFTALFLEEGALLGGARSDERGHITFRSDAQISAVIVAREGFRPRCFVLSNVSDAQSSRTLVTPTGQVVAGAVATRGAEPCPRLTLSDDRPFEAPAVRDARVWEELATLGITHARREIRLSSDGSFEFDGLDDEWTGALELPESWRFAATPDVGAVERERELLLLAPANGLRLEVSSPLVVRGRLIDLSTGAGLDGARVRALTPQGSGDSALEATTRLDGTFELALARPRRAPKRWLARLDCSFGGAHHEARVDVEWSELERTRDLGVFPMAPGRRVTITVFDLGRSPVLGAVARVRVGSRWIESEPTASDGRTVLAGFPSNASEVTVGANGFTTQNVAIGDASELEVLLASCNRLDVFVREENGAPASNVILRVESPTMPLRIAQAGSTPDRAPFEMAIALDSTGTHTLSDLVPGAALTFVVLDFSGAELARAQTSVPSHLAQERIELVLPARNKAWLGRVVDERGRGLPRARVAIEHGGAAFEMTTDADGRFGSDETLTARAVDHLEVSRAGFVSVVRQNVVLPNDGPLEFVLRRGRSLEVTLVDADGRPLDTAALLATFESDGAFSADVVESGRQLFERLPATEGELQLELGGVTYRCAVGALDGTARFELPPTGEVRVEAVLNGVDPAARVCVVVRALVDAAQESRTYLRKDDQGWQTWSSVLPIGRYAVQLETRILGGGPPRVQRLGETREVEITAGRTLELTLP